MSEKYVHWFAWLAVLGYYDSIHFRFPKLDSLSKPKNDHQNTFNCFHLISCLPSTFHMLWKKSNLMPSIYINIRLDRVIGLKVIREKSRGGRFIWNKNWDLGWIWASSATFEASFFMFSLAKIFFKNVVDSENIFGIEWS